jgi:hypothetical protein
MNRLHCLALVLTIAVRPTIGLAYSADKADAEAECRAAAEMDHVTADDLDDYMDDCVSAALDAPEGDQEPAPPDNR